MERKIIAINPEFLIKSKKTKKLPKLNQPNEKTIRKHTYNKILKHIREQQEKKYNQLIHDENNEAINKAINKANNILDNDETQNLETNNDDSNKKFNETIEFLDESIAIKKGKLKQEIEQRKQMQNQNQNLQPIYVSNSINQSTNNNSTNNNEIFMQQSISQNNIQNPSQQLIPTQSQYNEFSNNNYLQHVEGGNRQFEEEYPKYRTDKRKKTIKKTYYLGNMPKLGKVSVLIPNRTIRKNIMTEKQKYNELPMSKIKGFLLNKGFIKLGTTAPDYLLLDMYKELKMIGGDVINHNVENLLSNFIAK